MNYGAWKKEYKPAKKVAETKVIPVLQSYATVAKADKM
jgi:hypothetical protein